MTQDVFSKLILSGPKDYKQARTNMLKQQIRTWDISDDKILSLFYSVPREAFVPIKYTSLAFADMCIPLPHGQSMMLPREEAKILQELSVKPEDRILVIGADSGFLLTLLSKLGKQVLYLDNDLEDLEGVKIKITKYHLTNITSSIGNLYHGWQELYPFDVILLTGSLLVIPEFLKNAITIKGRLFVVIGKLPIMEAMIITRQSENTWSEDKIFETLRPRMLDAKEPDSFVF